MVAFCSVRRVSGRLVLALIAAISLLADASVGFAQESTTEPKAPQAVDSAPASTSDWERLIYVPYRNLKDVLEKEGAAAFMPYGEFLKMWEKMRQASPQATPQVPVKAVLTSAVYTGRIEKDVAQLRVELSVNVLGKPWVELPLNFGDAAIGKMTASDDKILLQATGNGTYALLFPKAGEHKVQLELTTRVRTSPDGRGLEFDCPPSAITTFDLTVPAADQSIDLTPQGVIGASDGDDKSTHVKATLGATKKIAARWRPRISTAPVMEVLTSVQNVLDVRVADGLVHTHATLTYQVLRGQLDQLKVGVPLDQRILDVSAPGMKSWKAVQEDKNQVLTIDLLSNEAKTITVEIHAERPLPVGGFDVAGVDDAGAYRGLHALGEVRENGLLVLSQGSDLSLGVEQQAGLIRVEPAEAPEALRRPESQFYKFFTPKFTLRVAARPVEPRLLVDQETRLVFRDDELQSTTQFIFTVERAGVFELRVKLPEGFQVDRVDCEPMKEFQTPEGTGQLVVLLREKTRGRVALTVSGHLTLDPADQETHALPLLEATSVARENGTVLVYAPESLEVIADDRKVQGAQPARPEAAQLVSAPGTRLSSAWSYTRRPEIPVRTERKPTRLSARTATSITLGQELVEVQTLLTYQVQFAGIDTFRFALPEKVASRVQVESADPNGTPLKQQNRDAEATDGWVTWTVVLQRETTGAVPLRIRYDFKPEVKENSFSVSLEPVRVLESPGRTADSPAVVPASVSGEITVQKDRALSVAAKGEPLEPIDVRELTLLPQDGYLAYRYYKQPEKLTSPLAIELTATKNEIQPVVETVIGQALIEAVVTEENSVTYRCRYRLKTSERQRLTLELPINSEILDTLVAGRRVDLEKGAASTGRDRDVYRVNVARSTPADEPFVLAIVFRSPYKDNPLRGRGGNLKLVFPRVSGTGEKGAAAVAMQQLRTAIWVPREFALVGAPEDFSPERPTHLELFRGAIGYATATPELESWFGDAGAGLFAFTPSGRAYQYHRLGAADGLEVSYWKTNWFTWLISGALVLVGLVLVHTNWENRLTILLLGAFGVAMYGLRDADLTVNLVAAARWGLIVMLSYWLIRAVTRRQAAPVQAATAGAVLPPPPAGTSASSPEAPQS